MGRGVYSPRMAYVRFYSAEDVDSVLGQTVEIVALKDRNFREHRLHGKVVLAVRRDGEYLHVLHEGRPDILAWGQRTKTGARSVDPKLCTAEHRIAELVHEIEGLKAELKAERAHARALQRELGSLRSMRSIRSKNGGW